jgi:hypothetical protein
MFLAVLLLAGFAAALDNGVGLLEYVDAISPLFPMVAVLYFFIIAMAVENRHLFFRHPFILLLLIMCSCSTDTPYGMALVGGIQVNLQHLMISIAPHHSVAMLSSVHRAILLNPQCHIIVSSVSDAKQTAPTTRTRASPPTFTWPWPTTWSPMDTPPWATNMSMYVANEAFYTIIIISFLPTQVDDCWSLPNRDANGNMVCTSN